VDAVEPPVAEVPPLAPPVLVAPPEPAAPPPPELQAARSNPPTTTAIRAVAKPLPTRSNDLVACIVTSA